MNSKSLQLCTRPVILLFLALLSLLPRGVVVVFPHQFLHCHPSVYTAIPHQHLDRIAKGLASQLQPELPSNYEKLIQ